MRWLDKWVEVAVTPTGAKRCDMGLRRPPPPYPPSPPLPDTHNKVYWKFLIWLLTIWQDWISFLGIGSWNRERPTQALIWNLVSVTHSCLLLGQNNVSQQVLGKCQLNRWVTQQRLGEQHGAQRNLRESLQSWFPLLDGGQESELETICLLRS